MKRIVEFPMDDGGCVLVEVDIEDSEEEALVPASRGGRGVDDVTAKASMSFEAAMEKAKPVAAAIIKKLRSISDPPDEMEVEFGLKLSAEAGAVLAAAGAEANYTVTLTWKREKKEENKQD